MEAKRNINSLDQKKENQVNNLHLLNLKVDRFKDRELVNPLIAIKEVDNQDNPQVDKIVLKHLQLHRQLQMEVAKKNIDFQDQKKVKKIVEIHHQVQLVMQIIQANRLQKILILDRKLQVQLLHLMVDQVKVEWQPAQKKENINLERGQRKMEVSNKVDQKVMETEIKIKEAVEKIKTLQLALEMESNKNQHQKISKVIKNK